MARILYAVHAKEGGFTLLKTDEVRQMVSLVTHYLLKHQANNAEVLTVWS